MNKKIDKLSSQNISELLKKNELVILS